LAIGEKIWEGKGKVTGTTVKSVGSDGASMEFNAMAMLKGVGRHQGIEFRDVGTVTGTVRPGGILMGSGQGILATQEGDTIAYKGLGVGRFEKGVMSAFIAFGTSSQKLSWMNSLIVLSELKLDATSQEFTSEAHEWSV